MLHFRTAGPPWTPVYAVRYAGSLSTAATGCSTSPPAPEGAHPRRPCAVGRSSVRRTAPQCSARARAENSSKQNSSKGGNERGGPSFLQLPRRRRSTQRDHQRGTYDLDWHVLCAQNMAMLAAASRRVMTPAVRRFSTGATFPPSAFVRLSRRSLHLSPEIPIP